MKERSAKVPATDRPEASAGAEADDPAFITAGGTKFGGVDPLGLRQINFNLMEEVFPGLNNVARHVRPSSSWRGRGGAPISARRRSE